LTASLRAAIAARGMALDDVDDLGGALGTSAGLRVLKVDGYRAIAYKRGGTVCRRSQR
jgi:hypothetical protein